MMQHLNGYTNLRHIAAGGFGDVYVGHHERTNREVAIKIMALPKKNRTVFVRRFEFEAGIIASLEHPHIVPIYDYWYNSDGAYLVMRYVRGGNLSTRLSRGALQLDEAISYIGQIASALDTAHRNQIVHQDIKPANILLDDAGNCYLTDFGIARDLEGDIDMAFDEDNRLHGSPKYISPDHLRREEITPKSDIYSLGILAYEMLTGQPPFDSANLATLLQHHVHSPLPSLQEAKMDLPFALNQVLKKATMKDAAQRYASVLDFASDLQDIVTQLQFAPA